MTRAVADDDRRALRLQITDDGRAIVSAAEAGMRERLDDLLARVDDPETVHVALVQLHAALDERREQRRVAREGT